MHASGRPPTSPELPRMQCGVNRRSLLALLTSSHMRAPVGYPSSSIYAMSHTYTLPHARLTPRPITVFWLQLTPDWPAYAHPALVRLGRACLAPSPEKRPSFEAIVKVRTFPPCRLARLDVPDEWQVVQFKRVRPMSTSAPAGCWRCQTRACDAIPPYVSWPPFRFRC
jgi:hypothetical protein